MGYLMADALNRLFSVAEIEIAIKHHKRIIATMGNPIPDAIKDAVGMFQQLLDTMRELEKTKSDLRAVFFNVSGASHYLKQRKALSNKDSV